MDISELEKVYEETVLKELAKIKSQSKTYLEAIDSVRKSSWPDERPNRNKQGLLSLICKEIERRLQNEIRSVEIQDK